MICTAPPTRQTTPHQAYPIGIPVLYGYVLWTNRESLNPTAQAKNVSPAELEEIMLKRVENPDLVPSMLLWKDFGEIRILLLPWL